MAQSIDHPSNRRPPTTGRLLVQPTLSRSSGQTPPQTARIERASRKRWRTSCSVVVEFRTSVAPTSTIGAVRGVSIVSPSRPTTKSSLAPFAKSAQNSFWAYCGLDDLKVQVVLRLRTFDDDVDLVSVMASKLSPAAVLHAAIFAVTAGVVAMNNGRLSSGYLCTSAWYRK